jgi:hypothetical protein
MIVRGLLNFAVAEKLIERTFANHAHVAALFLAVCCA